MLNVANECTVRANGGANGPVGYALISRSFYQPCADACDGDIAVADAADAAVGCGSGGTAREEGSGIWASLTGDTSGDAAEFMARAPIR